jgi:PIN domain nuclease of toxin-antitoxin system
MQFLLDTVTIIRHFSDSGIIGKKAQDMLDADNNSFYISVISLMEIMYLAEKNRIKINLSDTMEKINSSALYTIIDLTVDVINVATNINFYELHDRMILATALLLDVPILSSDERFQEIKKVKVIWN